MRIFLLICVLFGVRVHCAYEFDCRRYNICLNGGTCKTGACTCPSGFSGDICDIIDGTICVTDPCLNGGTCYVNDGGADTCSCPYGFLGPTCEINAAEVICGGSTIQYVFNFADTFSGLVALDGVDNPPPVCSFESSTANGITTYSLTIRLDAATDLTNCGNDYLTEIPKTDSTDYIRTIRIQYMPDLVTIVDEIGKATCTHRDADIDMSVSISSISLDGIGNLTVTDTVARYTPVALALLDKDQQPMPDVVELYVGDTIYLQFYLTETAVFTSLMITSCTANDTEAVAPKEFLMFDQGCPTKSGKKTTGGQVAMDKTLGAATMPARSVLITAFKFINKDQLGIVCMIKLCQDGDTSCDVPSDAACEAVIAPTAEGTVDSGAPVTGEGDTPPAEPGAVETPSGDTAPAETGAAGDTPPGDTAPAETGAAGDTPPADTGATGDTPPADTGAGDSGIVRKRRAAEDEGERTVSTVLTVRGPRGYTSDANKGQPVETTVESCLARSEILAILIVLSAVVCILFIACFVLALCLIRRRQKRYEGSMYNTDARFQIPRAHVNDAYREM